MQGRFKMSEVAAGRNKRRRPLIAIVLSLIMPGLGHVYCGRIVRGIILGFLSCILIPVIVGRLAVTPSSVRMAVIIAFIPVYWAVWLFAIIGSWYAARHTADSYILKDYNRWYVYIIFILLDMGGSMQISFIYKQTRRPYSFH